MVAEARKNGFFIDENSLRKSSCTVRCIQVDVSNHHRIWDAEKHLFIQLLNLLQIPLMKRFLLKRCLGISNGCRLKRKWIPYR